MKAELSEGASVGSGGTLVPPSVYFTACFSEYIFPAKAYIKSNLNFLLSQNY